MTEFPPGRIPAPEPPPYEEEAPIRPAAGWRPPETAPAPPEPFPSEEDEDFGEEMAPLPPPPGLRRPRSERGDVEEIAESIVEERVRGLEAEISEISRRLDNLTARMSQADMGAGRATGTAGVEEIKAGLDSYKTSRESKRVTDLDKSPISFR